jgi:hypothetical protein
MSCLLPRLELYPHNFQITFIQQQHPEPLRATCGTSADPDEGTFSSIPAIYPALRCRHEYAVLAEFLIRQALPDTALDFYALVSSEAKELYCWHRHFLRMLPKPSFRLGNASSA